MIEQEGKSFIVELRKNLYSRESIDKAVKDFASVCKIKKQENASSVILIFPENEFIAGLELCNYVLGLEKIKQERAKEK